MSVGCKIIRDFRRPATELVELFRNMPVANIDDNMNRIAAVDSGIEPIGYKGQLLGTAFTVRVAQGDNLMFHAAMDLARPGDVIVIDAGGFTERAIFGRTGWPPIAEAAGSMVSSVTEPSGIGADWLPWRTSVYMPAPPRPTAPTKTAPGRSMCRWPSAGKIVYPGDIVAGDDDGVLFIRPEEAEALAEATGRWRRKKPILWRTFSTTALISARGWDEKLREIGCEII